MTTIPSNEINRPGLHADTLGFTFIWNNHFLRGIYPSAVDLARSYFESGFIDKVVSKQLFPKTWISDFENEQFGMILEHEMISPVLYATEWNFYMLKDAALMVLDIAQIALEYGYNMVDCHKLNVLFRNNRPIYVDLGSFVPKGSGETGWRPYNSFMRSYYYILDMWKDGASQLAKRMMAPGVELNSMDYFLYKKRFYRLFPTIAKNLIYLYEGINMLACFSEEQISGYLERHNKTLSGICRFIQKVVRKIKILPSQNLDRIECRVKRMNLFVDFKKKCGIGHDALIGSLVQCCPNASSVTFIDCEDALLYEYLLGHSTIDKIVSIHQSEKWSIKEYLYFKTKHLNVCCTQFPLLNNSIVLKGRYPESRLSSDLVVVPNYSIPKGSFGIHNALVFFEKCQLFSTSAVVLIQLVSCSEEQKKELELHSVFCIEGNLYMIKDNSHGISA